MYGLWFHSYNRKTSHKCPQMQHKHLHYVAYYAWSWSTVNMWHVLGGKGLTLWMSTQFLLQSFHALNLNWLCKCMGGVTSIDGTCTNNVYSFPPPHESLAMGWGYWLLQLQKSRNGTCTRIRVWRICRVWSIIFISSLVPTVLIIIAWCFVEAIRQEPLVKSPGTVLHPPPPWLQAPYCWRKQTFPWLGNWSTCEHKGII